MCALYVVCKYLHSRTYLFLSFFKLIEKDSKYSSTYQKCVVISISNNHDENIYFDLWFSERSIMKYFHFNSI